MYFDAVTTACIVHECRQSMLGGVVTGVDATGPLEICIEFRRSRQASILLSAHARWACMAVLERRPQTVAATQFVRVLRKHLRGSRLVDVAQRGLDRMVRLRFEGHDESGEWGAASLVLEVMGRHSNLVLVDDDDIIIDCIKRVPARLNRVRELLPGVQYLDPPLRAAANWSVEAPEIARLPAPGEAEPADALRQAIVLSPLMQREVLHRAGQMRAESGAAAVESALRDVIAECTHPDPRWLARGVSFSPVPLQHASQSIRAEEETVSACLLECRRHAQARERLRSHRANLMAATQRWLKQRRRLLANCRRDLSKAAAAEWHRRQGELILANLHAIEPGATELRVQDFGEPGAPMTAIRLEPDMAPTALAQRHFSRYRKLQRTAQQLPARIAALEAEIESAEKIATRLPSMERAEELERTERQLHELGAPVSGRQRDGGAPGRRTKQPAFRSTTTASGKEILWGRNSRENQELLSRVARPNDYWFHVRNLPGSHVILRTANAPERVSPEDVEEAARVAAASGRARRQMRVEVDYCLVKHVRRQKGGGPGQVVYTHHKTIVVRRD